MELLKSWPLLLLAVLLLLLRVWHVLIPLRLKVPLSSYSRSSVRYTASTRKNPIREVRVMAVLGSGGHTTELLKLMKRLDRDVYTYISFVLAETDKTSQKRTQLDYDVREATDSFDIIPRSREVRHVSFDLMKQTTFSSKVLMQFCWFVYLVCLIGCGRHSGCSCRWDSRGRLLCGQLSWPCTRVCDWFTTAVHSWCSVMDLVRSNGSHRNGLKQRSNKQLTCTLCMSVCVCLIPLCGTSRDVYPYMCSCAAVPSPRHRNRLQDHLLRELCSRPALVTHRQALVLRSRRVRRAVATVADKVPTDQALGRHLLAPRAREEKKTTKGYPGGKPHSPICPSALLLHLSLCIHHGIVLRERDSCTMHSLANQTVNELLNCSITP